MNGSGPKGYRTAAALENPIIPNVEIKHTQLLINGEFVDAASGYRLCFKQYLFICLDMSFYPF